MDGALAGRCGQGFLVLAAAHRDDAEADVDKMADRILGLRVFSDPEGKMNLSLADLPESDQPRILAVSNFTLYGDCAKSRRPSFILSAPYDRGRELFDRLVAQLGAGTHVQTGVFGAHMDVRLENDGPVTLVLDVGPTGGEA